MVLDFEPGQAAYDVDAMESPAEHPDAADARQRRKAGPAPVTLISCLEARPASLPCRGLRRVLRSQCKQAAPYVVRWVAAMWDVLRR